MKKYNFRAWALDACMLCKADYYNFYTLIFFAPLSRYIEDIQMFLLNMSFILRVKRTIFIFHEWQSHE